MCPHTQGFYGSYMRNKVLLNYFNVFVYNIRNIFYSYFNVFNVYFPFNEGIFDNILFTKSRGY